MMPRKVSILACFLALALSACSHNPNDAYHWSTIYRPDVKTVAVPIFASKDYQRGVEFALSKAVINQIEANTPYKVVPRERADTILEGEILEVRVNTISQDSRSAVPQEQLLAIICNFTWKDLRTGRILMARRGWQETATYYATLGEGREEEGTLSATEKLALSIVHQMESDW